MQVRVQRARLCATRAGGVTLMISISLLLTGQLCYQVYYYSRYQRPLGVINEQQAKAELLELEKAGF
jgi:hypothetical protein